MPDTQTTTQPRVAADIPDEYKSYTLPITRNDESVDFKFARGRATPEAPDGKLFLKIDKETPVEKIARWVGAEKLVRLALPRLNVNFKGMFEKSTVDGNFDAGAFASYVAALEIFIRTKDEILEDMQECLEQAKKLNRPSATASLQEKAEFGLKLAEIYDKMGRLNEELESRKRKKDEDND